MLDVGAARDRRSWTRRSRATSPRFGLEFTG